MQTIKNYMITIMTHIIICSITFVFIFYIRYNHFISLQTENLIEIESIAESMKRWHIIISIVAAVLYFATGFLALHCNTIKDCIKHGAYTLLCFVIIQIITTILYIFCGHASENEFVFYIHEIIRTPFDQEYYPYLFYNTAFEQLFTRSISLVVCPWFFLTAGLFFSYFNKHFH